MKFYKSNKYVIETDDDTVKISSASEITGDDFAKYDEEISEKTVSEAPESIKRIVGKKVSKGPSK